MRVGDGVNVDAPAIKQAGRQASKDMGSQRHWVGRRISMVTWSCRKTDMTETDGRG